MIKEPTIGRIVMYVDEDENLHPAMITSVRQDVGSITLTVFTTSETKPGIGASYRPVLPGRDALPGGWFWPDISALPNVKRKP